MTPPTLIADRELRAQDQRWREARARLDPVRPFKYRRARPDKRQIIPALPPMPPEFWEELPYLSSLPFDEPMRLMAPSMPHWKRIAIEVARKHHVSLNHIKSDQRSKQFVMARHEVFYRCAMETKLSLPHIGRLLGGKDHTTVLYGMRQHAKRMQEAGDE